MKNKVVLLAVVLSLSSGFSVAFAEQKEEVSNNSFLSEINLYSSEKSDYIANVTDGLEYKKESDSSDGNSADTEKTHILPIFDLKGGVQKEEPPVEPSEPKGALSEWWHGDYATGNWFGLRSNLEEHGVTFGSSLLYSPFGKTRGGMVDTRKGAGYTLFNLDVTLDTEKMGLWKGGTFYMLYQNKRGSGLSEDYMGDYMVLDGWDFREMNQLSEVWYQHVFFDEKARIKFGKQDANADFCYLNSGFDFMNTAFSIMPTVPIPTYPDPTFGFMAEISPKEWLSVRNGVYHKDGAAFDIAEIEVKTKIKNLPGRYFTGGWAYSGATEVDTEDLDINGDPITNTYDRNFGWYAAFEQMLYKEKPEDEEDAQGLTLFGQVGLEPSARNDIDKYFGAGLHYKGLIPKRDEDIAGVGVAVANFSRRLDSLYGMQGQETAVECFYRYNVTPWFYLQPDVQFIMNPSGSYPSSCAIGLRSVFTF